MAGDLRRQIPAYSLIVYPDLCNQFCKTRVFTQTSQIRIQLHVPLAPPAGVDRGRKRRDRRRFDPTSEISLCP
ncbi:MAG: hypothetical protein V3U59_09815, partial [Gammaproteobacteria bacterium]